MPKLLTIGQGANAKKIEGVNLTPFKASRDIYIYMALTR